MIMTEKAIRPPSIPGFDHISREWRQQHGKIVARIMPGQFYVTDQDEMIVTVLGSCIAACIRDSEQGIGGMNHFMLPEMTGNKLQIQSEALVSQAMRYGNYAMEHLINTILSYGGKRKNLEVKVFGGGKIIESLGDTGQRNIDFILDYINTEALRMVSHDLGDIYPRQVHYFPKTGRARVRKLKTLHTDQLVISETHYKKRIQNESIEGQIELF